MRVVRRRLYPEYATGNVGHISQYHKLVIPTGNANVYAEMGSGQMDEGLSTIGRADSAECNVLPGEFTCFLGHDMSNNTCRDYKVCLPSATSGACKRLAFSPPCVHINTPSLRGFCDAPSVM